MHIVSINHDLQASTRHAWPWLVHAFVCPCVVYECTPQSTKLQSSGSNNPTPRATRTASTSRVGHYLLHHTQVRSWRAQSGHTLTVVGSVRMTFGSWTVLIPAEMINCRLCPRRMKLTTKYVLRCWTMTLLDLTSSARALLNVARKAFVPE